MPMCNLRMRISDKNFALALRARQQATSNPKHAPVKSYKSSYLTVANLYQSLITVPDYQPDTKEKQEKSKKRVI